MLKKKEFWITITLVNLCIVPLLGLALRTKFLFDIPFIDYRNVLSAHSHFAFGGWITLALMIFFIDNLLPVEAGSQNKYQFILWGTQLSAAGMVITFPVTGYGLLAISFSTWFIFFTYGFTWIFIRDFLKTKREKSISILALSSLACLIISSIGPFTLAYILATKTGNTIIYHDALYTFLHFQYNGFFTMAVFALFINHIKQMLINETKKSCYMFSVFLALSVVPTLFLALAWHQSNNIIRILAIIGTALIFFTLIFFFRFIIPLKKGSIFSSRTAYRLWVFAMISFTIKIVLQMGTIIPEITKMVFGYRPIIIGFLHLVFLGFVTFYLLAHLIQAGAFDMKKGMTKRSLIIFSAAIILNETILMLQGAGLMFLTTHHVYPWLLWIVSIALFAGALLILIARFKNVKSTI